MWKVKIYKNLTSCTDEAFSFRTIWKLADLTGCVCYVRIQSDSLLFMNETDKMRLFCDDAENAIFLQI